MTEGPLVSIVIPVWRDERALARGLRLLRSRSDIEVIAACVLGEEPRYDDLRAVHPNVIWVSAPRGRAVQMNAGARAARGRWLLFLHADSVLPPDWFEAVARADARTAVVAGAFRLSIDSPAWQARIVEAGVRLRVAALGLPYGDQGLFVRRAAFEQLGGYRDLPLMEDVDLVRRVSAIGHLARTSAAVRTSARRWQHDGWFRRSARNLQLASAFLLGAPAARLARTYFRRHATAVVVMARAPWRPGKTRLAAGLDPEAHADLRRAILLDTLDVIGAVPGIERIIACEPAGDCERMREVAGARFDVMAQRGDDLGGRLVNVFQDVFRLGIEAAVVIGSDLPDLPRRLLQQALEPLRRDARAIVLGPAADGGYYLIGMSRPHPELFEGIHWSSDKVLEQTRRAAAQWGLSLTFLDAWADVDHPADLERVLTSASGTAAVRTRALASRLVPERSVERTAEGSGRVLKKGILHGPPSVDAC